MNKVLAAILVFAVLVALGLWAFVRLVLPAIESPTAAGLVGALIGTLAGIFGSLVTATVGSIQSTKQAEERLKDRISDHALKLTQMDYELRQKSLDLTGQPQHFLAPVKVYRTFYRALLELHTSGNWPTEPEELGLLNIFPLGPAERRNRRSNTTLDKAD